jgi:hypothetical protein
MKHSHNWMPPSATVFLLLCLLLPSAVGQSGNAQAQHPPYKRLILNDGSYERIREYSIQGDRVRYFCSERNTWEELPSSMVDWPATEKFALQEAHESSDRGKEALDHASREYMEEEARTPRVAPGVRLPEPDEVLLLDVYQGLPALSPLTQNGADLHKNTGSNMLRGVFNPIAGPRQTIELEGLHALIQSHVSTPDIFFPFDPADPTSGYDGKTAKDHLRIVRCEAKKENRIVLNINIAIYGKVKQRARDIAARVEPISDYWAKITPVAPLEPGEYALVEFDDKGLMNQFVWDFGVDPDAPPNPVISGENPVRKEPVLIQKTRKKADHH